MEKVGIIGMGVSGMGVLSGYEKENLYDEVELFCFDSENSFGRGFPFRKDSDEILLNVTVDRVSYDYENPEDFKNWLLNNGIKDDYVPRHLMGDYFNEKLEDTLKVTGGKKVTEKIIDIEYLKDKNKWKVFTKNNEYIFDRIHLCCGELPQLDPYDLKDKKNYIQPIYPAYEQCNMIEEDDSVCVVGTSLSGIDISRYLIKERKVKDISMFSRSNVLPTVRGEFHEKKLKLATPEKIKKIKEKNNGFISFEKFDELFEKELKIQGTSFSELSDKYIGGIKAITKSINEDEELIIIQGMFANLADLFNEGWLGFTKKDREKFSEKYEDFLQVFGGPIPPSTGKIIVENLEKDRFRVLDNIVDIKYNEEENKFYLIEEDENKEKSINRKVDYVCNATGLDTSMKAVEEDSFLGKLLDKRYAQIDKYDGITIIPDYLNVVSPKFGVFDNLHSHGVLITGVQLRNNSISVIQEAAHNLIKRLY